MLNFLFSQGFLNTRAPMFADLSIILILVSAILFTVAWRLAVRKKIKTHCKIQASATLLNTLVVLVVMIPSFVLNTIPGIPARLNEVNVAMTTVHAIFGSMSVLLGIFVVLRAYRLVPKALRFKKYKPWMRTSYILYMLMTISGTVLYLLVYVVSPR
jgi:uncharacterized membrane protein YozB (DUF420 family)